MAVVEDDEAVVPPEALQRQLVGLNGLADLIADQRLQPSTTAAVLRKKEDTLRDSYAALLHSAHSTYRQHLKAAGSHPLHPPSSMSPQLRLMERVWHSLCRHSRPGVTHFTLMVDAYGREGRRTRIKDLYQRYVADRERHLAQRRPSASIDAADPPTVESVDPAELERLRLKEERATRVRELRMEAAGFPSGCSLYPSVHLDTVAYNAVIAAYTASLAVETLTPSSPALQFPFSLLPSFQPDAKTYSTLMSLHCRMRDTAGVLRLFEDFKRLRQRENAELHGQRPLQHIRAQRKEESQYLHSILLRSLGQAGEVEAAERVWAALKAKEERSELSLTRPLYHAMLELYAGRNEHEKMRALSVEMRRKEMALDADGVCTVVHALCKAGHVDDAVMLHSRLAQGSLGLAAPHRKSYLALLSHLCALPSVPFNRVVDVFAQGMRDGSLRSPTAHRQKWVVDLRAIPLWLLPVSLHWHLDDMLGAFMALWRAEGKKAAVSSIPHRGLLLLLGKNRQEKDRHALEALRASLSSVDADDEHRPHALSASALDPDAEEEKGEDGEEGLRRAGAARRVLVDPFATEEESAALSALEALEVQGSFVQRYVQSLLREEWPAMEARLKNSGGPPPPPASSSASSLTIDASSLVLSRSVEPPTSALLTVRRNEVEFWLCTRAHVRAEGGADAELFPAPRLHGAKDDWMAAIRRNVAERAKKAAEGEGTSLTARLQDWKGREREELRMRARVFRTKRLPLRLQQPLEGRPSVDAAKAKPTSAWGRGERRRRGEVTGLQTPPAPPTPDMATREGWNPRRRSRAPPSFLSSETLSALLRSDAALSSRTRQAVKEMATETLP